MISLIEFDRKMLDHSWEWLQNPVLRQLIDAPEISREQQINWFKELPEKENYRIWGISLNKEPVGVMGLKNIETDSAEYFGYLGLETLWGKGLGENMLALAVEIAQKKGIAYLWLKVLKTNTRALRAYEKFGFKTIETKGVNYIMRYQLYKDGV